MADRRGNGLRWCHGCSNWRGEGDMRVYDPAARDYIQLEKCKRCQTKGGRNFKSHR